MSNQESDDLDWLTGMDEEILDVLSTGLTLTPSVIAENIDRSQKGVGNRLSALQAGGLVEKVERGKYRLTDEGMSVIFEPAEQSDAEKIGSRRGDIRDRKRLRQELGVGMEEYREAVQEELSTLTEEELGDENVVEEAFERVEDRLRDRTTETSRDK